MIRDDRPFVVSMLVWLFWCSVLGISYTAMLMFVPFILYTSYLLVTYLYTGAWASNSLNELGFSSLSFFENEGKWIGLKGLMLKVADLDVMIAVSIFITVLLISVIYVFIVSANVLQIIRDGLKDD